VNDHGVVRGQGAGGNMLYRDARLCQRLDQLLVVLLPGTRSYGIWLLVASNKVPWTHGLDFVHLDIIRIEREIIDQNLLWLEQGAGAGVNSNRGNGDFYPQGALGEACRNQQRRACGYPSIFHDNLPSTGKPIELDHPCAPAFGQ
jgi:hypothetical protein